MGRKARNVIARILAVLIAFTLLPFDLWGNANVVMAEELSKVQTEDAVDEEEDSEAVEDVDEKETLSAAEDAEDFVTIETDEKVESATENEVKEEKKETDSVETDNKAITATGIHYHNFTESMTLGDDYFKISPITEASKVSEITYEDKSGQTLTLTKAIDVSNNNKVTISFNAGNSGTLVLVTGASKKWNVTKPGDSKSTGITSDNAGVLEVQSSQSGNWELSKNNNTVLYYIAFIPEGSEPVKQTVATPTAEPANGEVTVDSKIQLSCATDGATIHYTTDGTDPIESESTSTTIGQTQIAVASCKIIDNKITIWAYATKDNYTDSESVKFEYTVAKAANQLDEPIADPAPEEGAVVKGTKVTLKSNEADASIYFTIDETDPIVSDEMLYKEPIEITEATTIKAIAVKEGFEPSFPASFTYTIKQPTIHVDENSASIISNVEKDGDVFFINQDKNEVFDVKLKAQENDSPTDEIKAKAESLKEEDGTTILYYDFSLANAENENDIVSISEESTGKLNIKMPYAIASGVNKRNKIIVLHNTDEIAVVNESDGFSFLADSFSPYTVIINPAGAVQDLTITKSAGYEEGAYAEWKAIDGADGYMAYVAPAGGKFERIDDELVREYSDHWRVDTVGLAKGTYYLKIDAVVLETKGTETTATVIATNTTDVLKVTNYDRSGFAFSKNSPFKTGSGAYNDDGTLREGAQVIYVTAETAKTCTAMLHSAGANKDPVKVTGIQSIIDLKNKGDATKNDILDFRIIGCVSKSDLDHISSSAEGLQIKGKNNYSEMNITIEGIGEDAVVKDFGFLIRGCGNVELRNFAIMAFMDDGVSMDTGNCNIWVHDLDIFYGSTGGDSDQAKGDGSVDIKAGSTYITVAYNHFWDSGKCSLCGMEESTDDEFMVTYHHNWFDHSDSRHARVRRGTVHLYNNYYDGNSKYGVGAANASNIFVESNYFRNCNAPMLIASQASDIASGKSTMSNEAGGMIKAYNNVIQGGNHLIYANSDNGTSSANSTSFDAYLVSNRSDTVPNSIVTLKGGTSYNNFDTSTSYDLGVKEDNIDTPENVPTVVMEKAGRLNGGDFKWEFDNAKEDTNYGVIKELKDAVVGYKSSVKTVGGKVSGNVTVIEGDNSNAPSGGSQTVNAPTANKPSGEVEKGTEIILSATENAEIYYTLNGLDPTKNSNSYTKPFIINNNTMIKAIAVVGQSESDVSTFKYTIPSESIPVPDPGPNPNPGGNDQPENTKIVAYEFNPQGSNMGVGEMPAADTEYGTSGYFTIGNAESKGKIATANTNAPNPSKSSVTKYSVRYQFGGTAATATDPKAIRFTTENKARVSVGAHRTNDKERNLYLDTDENVKVLTRTATEYTFDIIEAGSHGIYAKDGDIAILYVIVEEFVPNGGSDDNDDPSGDDKVVDVPVATPGAGDLKKGECIQLTAENGADIYYTMTIDGSEPTDPTTADTKYNDPITITAESGATVQIKAIAVVDGKSSQAELFTYTIVDDAPEIKKTLSKPEASPAPADGTTYPIGIKIGLTNKENGMIYYTLDGSDPKQEDGETPSETSKPLSENETISLDTAGTYTIKAFAVKEGYLPSDTEVFVYIVSENATLTQLAQPVITPASKKVEKGEKITVTIEKAEGDPADTEIYYTTDKTTPANDKLRYTKPFEIVVDETTTINAIAMKSGAIPSAIASVTYTVNESNVPKPENVGLKVVLKHPNEVYTYTGSAIKPDIVVWNNSDKLVEGADYVVKYSNNINASEGVKENKKPKITITGKGNLTGNASTTFEIGRKKLNDLEGAGSVAVGGVERGEDAGGFLLAVENAKLSPSLYYGGAKLTNKDFSISKTDKCVKTDEGKTVTITGKGNFDGTLEYKLKVVGKNDLKKFTVTFNAPDYTYNGQPQKFEPAESDIKDASGSNLNKDNDYTIVYQKDITNAGKVKFTVVGLGYYTGSVTKSYTIKPKAATTGMELTGISSEPYPYTGSAGVTIATAGVTYTDESGKTSVLEEGKDYKLAYGNNKKIGDAKVTASFIGNYKGSKAVTKTFKIGANALNNDTEGLKIAVADMVYTKPGVYKSVPYVSVNGVEVKSSEYTVKYYTDAEHTKEMGSKNKITIPDTESKATVYMKITGKDKGNYKGTELTKDASYNVYKKASDSVYDLSKAKIVVYTDWSNSAIKTTKMEYTGKQVEPGVLIELKQGKTKITLKPEEVKQLEIDKKLKIQYSNNVNKGKAAITINGDGETYVGGKTATFSITTKSLKNTKVLEDLFKNAAATCNVRVLLEQTQ